MIMSILFYLVSFWVKRPYSYSNNCSRLTSWWAGVGTHAAIILQSLATSGTARTYKYGIQGPMERQTTSHTRSHTSDQCRVANRPHVCFWTVGEFYCRLASKKKICCSVTNNQVRQEIGYLRSVLLPDIDLGIFMLWAPLNEWHTY